MTITYERNSATISDGMRFPFETTYVESTRHIRLGSIRAERTSATQSVLDVAAHEDDLNPYEFMRSSHALAFWDAREEDLYDFSDGEPV